MFDYEQRPPTKELDTNWDNIFGKKGRDILSEPPDAGKILADVYNKEFKKYEDKDSKPDESVGTKHS